MGHGLQTCGSLLRALEPEEMSQGPGGTHFLNYPIFIQIILRFDLPFGVGSSPISEQIQESVRRDLDRQGHTQTDE